MTEVVIVAVAVAVALVYAARPLRDRAESSTDFLEALVEDAKARKRQALDAIVELESEVEVGKLSESDLAVLRDRYEAEAVAALRELDRLEAAGETDDAYDVEQEIARLRVSLTCAHCGGVRSTSGTCTRCGR